MNLWTDLLFIPLKKTKLEKTNIQEYGTALS